MLASLPRNARPASRGRGFDYLVRGPNGLMRSAIYVPATPTPYAEAMVLPGFAGDNGILASGVDTVLPKANAPSNE